MTPSKLIITFSFLVFFTSCRTSSEHISTAAITAARLCSLSLSITDTIFSPIPLPRTPENAPAQSGFPAQSGIIIRHTTISGTSTATTQADAQIRDTRQPVTTQPPFAFITAMLRALAVFIVIVFFGVLIIIQVRRMP